MKKLTLEFKVQLIDNDYYLICKDNEIDICLSELKRIFTIPTEIKKAWIVLSEKKLSKQSVKIIAPHCPCCVEIDGKRKNIVGARKVLDKFGLPCYGTLYYE